MNAKDVVSLFGVLVALCLGIYNIWYSRQSKHMVDSLLLDNSRFELLKIATDIQALRTKVKTSLNNLRYRLKSGLINLTPNGKNEIQKAIDAAETQIEDLDNYVALDREHITSAHEITAPTETNLELNKEINRTLGMMKVRYSEAQLQKAMVDGLISDSENLLATVQ